MHINIPSDDEEATPQDKGTKAQGDEVTAEADSTAPQDNAPPEGRDHASTEGEEAASHDTTPDVPREDAPSEAATEATILGTDQETRAEPSTLTTLNPSIQVGLGSASSSATPTHAPAPASLSSTDASAPQSAKLPRHLVELTIERVQEYLTEVEITGQVDLYAQLAPLFDMVEELLMAKHQTPSTVQAGLQKAQDVAERCKIEQEEINTSLATARFKVTELEDALTKAKDEVNKLEQRLSALVSPDPQAVLKLRLEAIRQETTDRRTRARITQLEAEFEQLCIGLQ